MRYTYSNCNSQIQSTHLKVGFRGKSTFIGGSQHKLVHFFFIGAAHEPGSISVSLANSLKPNFGLHHKLMNMQRMGFQISRYCFNFLCQFQALTQMFAGAADIFKFSRVKDVLWSDHLNLQLLDDEITWEFLEPFITHTLYRASCLRCEIFRLESFVSEQLMPNVRRLKIWVP